MHAIRIFGAPGRYLQGAGALAQMGEHLARVGSSAVLVADRVVLSLFGERIVAACAQAGVHCTPVEFSGDITPEEIERLADVVQPTGVGFVIGCGGGKGIDAGKGVAHRLGLRVVTIPTAASNDAPTSKNYVLYDRSHRLLRVEHLPANPDVVVVDTEIIVTAPIAMFTAGIGDAVVKKFEVAQCVNANGPNMFGARACRAAVALADLCYDTLRERAVQALADVRARRVTEDVEGVVEATVLHSGLGFESGGLSISHAMTRGLSAVRGARDALHGHQVAYALLVQLTLENRSASFLEDIRQFLREVDLPVTLADLGLQRPGAQEIAAIADATMTAPHVRNFERSVSKHELVEAIEAVERQGTASG
ncbi:MAG TPA: glycerol dehydrogenase [Burkholderiales bacterium]|nr:glycerol dehydrogenase [Burkholderiales bacterium]